MSEFLFMNSIKMKRSKSLILTSLYHLKFFDILRRFQKNRVLILMYHRFSNKEEPFKIPQKVFENQILFLKKKYNFISLKYYSEVLNEKKAHLPNNPIILTIDDGYEDNYTFAYPILKKYSIPATIFITTDFVSRRAWLWFDKLKYILINSKQNEFTLRMNDRNNKFVLDNFKNRHATQLSIFDLCKRIDSAVRDNLLNELALELNVDVPLITDSNFEALTWDQIKEMQKNKIEFGSHTCSHPMLSRLETDELKHEIAVSKNEIEAKLSSEITSFCYPVGQLEDINDTVVSIIKETGYSCAVTAIHGSNNTSNTDKFLLKRISVLTDNKIMLSKELTQLI